MKAHCTPEQWASCFSLPPRRQGPQILSVSGTGPQAAGDQVRETSVLINFGALLANSRRFDEAHASLLEAPNSYGWLGTREQRVFDPTNLAAVANDYGNQTAAEAS